MNKPIEGGEDIARGLRLLHSLVEGEGQQRWAIKLKVDAIDEKIDLLIKSLDNFEKRQMLIMRALKIV